jgi:ribosomal protein S18 acetylase RimI-like enzyme
VPLVAVSADAVSDDIERLLEPSHGSLDSARAAAAEYRAGRWLLYGWMDDGNLIGCVGLEVRPEGATIRSLSVDALHRGRGVGRSMVEAALRRTRVPWFEAETDAEAVGFYERLGFTAASLGEKYPGIERFRCVRASFD